MFELSCSLCCWLASRAPDRSYNLSSPEMWAGARRVCETGGYGVKNTTICHPVSELLRRESDLSPFQMKNHHREIHFSRCRPRGFFCICAADQQGKLFALFHLGLGFLSATLIFYIFFKEIAHKEI